MGKLTKVVSAKRKSPKKCKTKVRPGGFPIRFNTKNIRVTGDLMPYAEVRVCDGD